jgi:hypothetical protein
VGEEDGKRVPRAGGEERRDQGVRQKRLLSPWNIIAGGV